MAKATYDGTYQDAKGNFYLIRKGDVIPDGAELHADPNAAPEPVEERAKPAAPENKAKAAPENRAK